MGADFLSVLGFVLMVAALIGLALIGSLLAPVPLVIACQLAAVALMIWARRTFGLRSFHLSARPTTGGLVTRGPYRLIRHPIYTAVCLFAWSGVMATRSWAAIALALLLTAGAIVRLSCEERLVSARYPEYREYARRSWRMIPGVF